MHGIAGNGMAGNGMAGNGMAWYGIIVAKIKVFLFVCVHMYTARNSRLLRF